MKILVVENSPSNGGEPWWWKYVTPIIVEFGVELRVQQLPDSGFGGGRDWKRRLELLKMFRNYDWIVTNQDGFSTLFIGFMRRLFAFKKPRHIVLEFITRERDASRYDSLKYTIFRHLLGRCDYITCSAKPEIQYYQKHLGLRSSQAVFLPLSGNPEWMAYRSRSSGDYILSAGRTMRDYRTLIEAVTGSGIKTLIVASPRNLQGLTLPDNVQVLYDIPQQSLLELMADSRLVMLPLENRVISCGQRVLLMAMALGKCTVVSKIGGTADYITDFETGVFVPPNDPAALKMTICDIWDKPKELQRIGDNAADAFAERHTVQIYTRSWIKLISDN